MADKSPQDGSVAVLVLCLQLPSSWGLMAVFEYCMHVRHTLWVLQLAAALAANNLVDHTIYDAQGNCCQVWLGLTFIN